MKRFLRLVVGRAWAPGLDSGQQDTTRVICLHMYGRASKSMSRLRSVGHTNYLELILGKTRPGRRSLGIRHGCGCAATQDNEATRETAPGRRSWCAARPSAFLVVEGSLPPFRRGQTLSTGPRQRAWGRWHAADDQGAQVCVCVCVCTAQRSHCRSRGTNTIKKRGRILHPGRTSGARQGGRYITTWARLGAVEPTDPMEPQPRASR